jgi:uncharacterized NAD(P)/FAD-binding protein YdhS
VKRVAVVGGGYAGTAFAIHLSRRTDASLDVTLVEPRERVGGGIAHSATDPDHRLNAPDVIHPLDPEDPLHFRRWLEATGRLAQDPEAWGSDGRLYPRRGDFGAYVADAFARAAQREASRGRLRHLRTRAVAIERSACGFRIGTDAGDLEVERCVIALGQEPTRLRLPGLPEAAAGVVDDPFAADALDGIARDAPVLVLGTGLSAADAVAALIGRGHEGSITCLSRRGLRPSGQNPMPATAPLWDHLAAEVPDLIARHGPPADLRTLVRFVRRDVRDRLARGEPWHGAIDDVRDAAGEIWRALAPADRARFLRHAKPWYDSHRFRIPPQTQDILTRAERRGQLGFEAGRVVRFRTGRTTSCAHSPSSAVACWQSISSTGAAATCSRFRGWGARSWASRSMPLRCRCSRRRPPARPS